MDLDALLPADLRGPATTLTPFGHGLSGAGIWRVERGGRTWVLKVAAEREPDAEWRRTLDIRRHAAEAGLSPRLVHVDEARRATLSEFVVDRGFPVFFRDPRTHDAALALLGRTLRRVHELPLPPGAPVADPRALLAATWARVGADAAVPPFVGEVVRRLLAEEPPPAAGAPVLSHNDVHPANLVWDGEHIVLLDWDVASANEPLYDLATIAMFLRLDDATSRALIAAHDAAPPAPLPPRFAYLRRLVPLLAGTMGLGFARERGYAGAGASETPESAASLGEFYQRLRTGEVSLATPEGQWIFGLALVKESLASSSAAPRAAAASTPSPARPS